MWDSIINAIGTGWDIFSGVSNWMNSSEMAGMSKDYLKEMEKMAKLTREVSESRWGYTRPLEEAQANEALWAIDALHPLREQQIGQELERGNMYMGVERQFLDEAMKGPDANKYAGRASADVSQAFAGQRGQMVRDAASMGINPSSGRFMSGMRRLSADQAKTEAFGRTQAFDQAEQERWNKMGTALNYRKNMPISMMSDQAMLGPQNANPTSGLSSAGSMYGSGSALAMAGTGMWGRSAQQNLYSAGQGLRTMF